MKKITTEDLIILAYSNDNEYLSDQQLDIAHNKGHISIEMKNELKTKRQDKKNKN